MVTGGPNRPLRPESERSMPTVDANPPVYVSISSCAEANLNRPCLLSVESLSYNRKVPSGPRCMHTTWADWVASDVWNITAARNSCRSFGSSVVVRTDWMTSPSFRRGIMSCGQFGHRMSSALSLWRQFSASLWMLYAWFRRRLRTEASVHCGWDPLAIPCAVVVASPARSLHSSSSAGGGGGVLVSCGASRRLTVWAVVRVWVVAVVPVFGLCTAVFLLVGARGVTSARGFVVVWGAFCGCVFGGGGHAFTVSLFLASSSLCSRVRAGCIV